MGREQLNVAMRNEGLWICDVCKNGKGIEEGVGAPTRVLSVQNMGGGGSGYGGGARAGSGGQAVAPAVAVSQVEKSVFRDRAQGEVERRRLMVEGEEEEELIDLGVALDSSIPVFEILIDRGVRRGQDVVSWVDSALMRFRRMPFVNAKFA